MFGGLINFDGHMGERNVDAMGHSFNADSPLYLHKIYIHCAFVHTPRY
jgi:hypothetical protein